MSFLAVTERESRQIEQQALLTPADPDAFDPGLFDGAATAAAVGLGRVGAVAQQFVGAAEYQAGALFTRPVDDLFDTDFTGFLDEKLRKEPANLTASMTPDPYTTGSVGKVLYGLVGIGAPVAIGTAIAGPVGGAAVAGATQALGTATDLKAAGVDDVTAIGGGMIEGAMTTAGVVMPAAIGGKVALNALLYGPAANVAQDVVASKSLGWFLDQQGYEDLGERYSEIQAESIIASALLGSAFGFIGARHAGLADASPADIDAAQAALDRKHIEIDTAPGVPADIQAAQTHAARMAKATEQMMNGEQVRVEDVGRGGEFVMPPEFGPGDAEIIAALKESGLPGVLDEVAALESDLLHRGRVLDEDPDAGSAVVMPQEVGAAAARAETRESPQPFFNADAPAESGYAYHVTTKDNFFDIQDDGLLKARPPDFGTDQAEWPDGSVANRVYFGKSPKATEPFIQDSNAVLIRTRHAVKQETGTPDLYADSDIAASELEYMGIGGGWYSVSSVDHRSGPDASGKTGARQAGKDQGVKATTEETWGYLSRVVAGDVVDGLMVRGDIPNKSSISATFSEYTVLRDVRSVPLSEFDGEYVASVSRKSLDRRTRNLADEIEKSGEINPLIVAYDNEGAYVLEGGHRFDALIALGKKNVPAIVVIDNDADQPAVQRFSGPGRSAGVDSAPQRGGAAGELASSRASTPEDTLTAEVLATRPGMEVATPEGAVDAESAARLADIEAATAEQESSGFMAAVNCFLRTDGA